MCVLVKVWQCLCITFCLSVTFPLLSFIDTGKPKCLQASDLKLTGKSTISQSLLLGSSLPLVTRLPHSLFYQIWMSERNTKDNRRVWAENGKCRSHFPPLCFTEADKNYSFLPGRPIDWHNHISTMTSRHFTVILQNFYLPKTYLFDYFSFTLIFFVWSWLVIWLMLQHLSEDLQ